MRETMHEILGDVDRWRAAGESVALATVVSTWGTAPRREGAKLAVSASGAMAGSVSGGCVEGALVDEALRVLREGRPRLVGFGVADETAWSVGLACGGRIEVFVAPLDPERYSVEREALLSDRPLAAATVIGGPETLRGRGLCVTAAGEARGSIDAAVDAEARAAARLALDEGACRRFASGAVELFVEPLLPRPQLVIVGGVHIAVTLAALARALGFRVVVVDPRTAFATRERFPQADRLVHAWPDAALEELGLSAASAVAVLSHDPKLDDPALRAALASAAFYVGALGSARTQEKRRERLARAGVPTRDLERIHGPIGLDLGGRAPEEIALAVMAEIVAARNRRRA
jgi:xanthine dehydrogenase accessory factor